MKIPVKLSDLLPGSIPLWILIGYLIALSLSISLTRHSSPALTTTNTAITGGSDYFTYWASWQIMLAGDNPYSPTSYQKHLNVERDIRHVMFTPPWSVLASGPFGFLPFSLSTHLWMAFNFVLLGMTCYYCLSLISRPSPVLLGLTCCFIPAGLCLALGQISLFLAAMFTWLLFSLKDKKDFQSGCLVTILTIKPHLFFLFFTVLGLYMLTRKRWMFFAGAATSVAAMTAMVTLIYPQALTDWMSFIFSKTPMDWVGSTLPAWFRLVVFHLTGHLPAWPTFTIPLIATALVAVHYLKKLPTLNWIQSGPWLVGLSVLLAPYGHPYDQCALLPLQCLMLASAFNLPLSLKKILILAGIAMLHVIWLIQISLISKELHWLAWFTPALLGWWLASRLIGQVDIIIAGSTSETQQSN